MLRILSAFIMALVTAGACTSDEGGPPVDVKSPYPNYSSTTETEYQLSGPANTQVAFSTRVTGETKTVGDKTYEKMVVESPDNSAQGRAEAYGNLLSPTEFEVAGGEYTMGESLISTLAGALGIASTATVTLDPPVTIDFDLPVGETRTKELTGTLTEGEGGTPESITVNVDYVLKQKGVTAETAAGSISDCWKFEVSSKVPLLGIPTDVKGQLLYSPTMGLVSVENVEPFKDLGLDFTGNSDFLDLGGGWASIHKTGVVGEGVSTLELDTYDVADQFDADKNTHAKMFVEIRWVDEETAKTDKEPFVDVVFGTAMGIFPSQLVQAPMSAFYPEENGKGYVYWVGFVDQAAKNEPGEGVSYRITTNYDPSFSKLRVTSRILYKLVSNS